MTQPTKYRKLPVEIEAVRFDGTNAQQVAEWIGEEQDGWTYSDRNDFYEIETLEGTMTALPGDWIIRGVQGEFYPCKPDIFAATYEAVED
ncbi:hypothetical protein GCM10009718_33090 [Isoptericola halotolerans]|uniref:Phage protein n=1 Tax=Isoptericola halotolerans TaxID=300560 RepID=A0ABX2A5R5_9MICO|nr:hypothetical protein [Isoptericola halotolerans]NOV98197.1 hypothetical protein [Isoptericola halotolerans]